MFGPGEKATLDLGRELHADVLIEEQKAHDYANAQGLDAVSVPEYLVVLLRDAILTVTQTVLRFQQLVALNRSPQPFIDLARRQIRAQGGNV